MLKPWRYQVYTGDSLNHLSYAFVNASVAESDELSAEQLTRIGNKPLRAPMVIVAIVKIVEHRKVPEIEQVLSTGASVQNLIMAAHFMNSGAIWRTGDLAFSRVLMNEIGLAEDESIAGFIYLGKEEGTKKSVPNVEQSDFVEWK